MPCWTERILAPILASCLLFAAIPAAHALPPGAQELYLVGKEALRDHEYEEALDAFKKTLPIVEGREVNTWQILVAVALTYEKMVRPVEALAYYERFIARVSPHEQVANAKWRQRAELARESAAELRSALQGSHVHVIIDSRPHGAPVFLNGVPAGPDADAKTPFATWLLPGVHAIRIVPPLGTEGLVIQEHKVVATVGKPVMVALDLEPFATPVASGTKDPAATPLSGEASSTPGTEESPPHLATKTLAAPPPSDWQTISGWTGVGVGLATLGTGILFTSFAADSHAAIETLDVSMATQEGSLKYSGLVEDLERHENTSLALYGLGATSLITGTLLLILDLEVDDAVETVLLEPIRGGVLASGSIRF